MTPIQPLDIMWLYCMMFCVWLLVNHWLHQLRSDIFCTWCIFDVCLILCGQELCLLLNKSTNSIIEADSVESAYIDFLVPICPTDFSLNVLYTEVMFLPFSTFASDKNHYKSLEVKHRTNLINASMELFFGMHILMISLIHICYGFWPYKSLEVIRGH